MALLEQLLIAPCTTDMLLQQLVSLYPDEDKAMLDEFVGIALCQLQNAGLLHKTR